jgi:hypothetical protein
VESASKPLSNDGIRKEREKKNIPEGKTDKNEKPHYGLKEHLSVNVKYRFILATTITLSSEHDRKYLPWLG